MTEDEILRGFSASAREDVRACLAFAANRERTRTSRLLHGEGRAADGQDNPQSGRPARTMK